MAHVRTIQDADLEREVIHSDLPVLIDFYADWCGPCKTMAPRLEKLAGDYAGALKVVKIDVDHNPMAVQMFRIQAMPTFVLVKDRQIVDVAQGAMDAGTLQQFVAPHVSKPAGPEVWDSKRLKLALEIEMARPVDLRAAADFARARIPGAVNVPRVNQPLDFSALTPGGQTYVFYDRTNDGVADIAARAHAAGVKAAALDGGFLGWEADGLRVQKG